jgi:hypothetical protein
MVANGVITFLLDWDTRTEKPTSSSSLTLIKAVLPYLGTADPQLRKELHHTLMWVDQMHGSKKDFTQYEFYLKNNTNDSTKALVTYMYDRDPPAALLSMARIYGTKDVEADLAAILKSDPKAALQSLADRPEWWARLYVAEMMKKNPQLRDPVILKKLEKDNHPLVREKVAEITSGK